MKASRNKRENNQNPRHFLDETYLKQLGFPGTPSGENPPANAGNIREVGLIPGWERSPGRGHGNPLQYSCLENPMDRGPWSTIVQRVAKNWT